MKAEREGRPRQGTDALSTELTETSERLLEAAGPVFARDGFEGATVREICRQAGTNVASVAYYYGDKMGLYRAVIRRIRETRERQYPVPESTDEPADQRLWRLIDTILSRMLACDESSWQFQLMMREMHSPTPIFHELVEDYFRPLFDRLTATIAVLVARQVPRHRIDQLALSVVGQCLYYRVGADVLRVLLPQHSKSPHYSREALVRHITAVTLSATKDLSGSEAESVFDSWCDSNATDPERTYSQSASTDE